MERVENPEIGTLRPGLMLFYNNVLPNCDKSAALRAISLYEKG